MSKYHCLLLIILFPFISFAQKQSTKFRQKSWQTFAYKITVAEAEQFFEWDSIPISRFLDREAAMTFQTDSVKEELLPTGNYILLSAVDNTIKATFLCVSNLMVLNINNKHRLQLDIRNKQGEFITNARVFVNNKEAVLNDSSNTSWIRKKKLAEAFVKVYTPNDTLYLTLEEKDEYQVQPLWKQRWQNYRSTKIYQWISWLPFKIKKLFAHTFTNRRIGAQGYIIFNQPKYKPLDTVKYKGYIVNKKGKQYNKDLEVHLAYYHNGENYDQLLHSLSPVTPGAYTGQFLLADTIPMDVTCRLIFKTRKQKEIIQNSFKTEDYLLDEIGTYQFSSSKEIYFKNDSLRFTATAKDANGLNVMGGRVTLVLLTKSINHFYRDTIFVQDTVYSKETALSSGNTTFIIPANELPRADITITAKLIFKNSNNELHDEYETIDYKYLSREISITQQGDSLKIAYIENGEEKESPASFYWNEEPGKPIHFPATIKIDPVAKDYTFYITDKDNKVSLEKYFEVQENYRLAFSRISKQDILGFALRNPYQIPVYFTVFNGNKVVATDKQTGTFIEWRTKMKHEHRAYKVRWQYIWAGKEQQDEQSLGLLYKLLDIKIGSNTSVYPGQKDSIEIDVKDYKGQPAANVNLTAVSYNSQFNKDIRIPEPPYLAKYKTRRSLIRKGYQNEEDNFSVTKQYLLGRNKRWINKFHLDSMEYYRLLFPGENYYDAVTPISNFTPQIAVNIVRQGVPQQIYLLYLNRELAYYNGVTDKMKYAFQVYPGNTQIGIRLRDKFIEIDSIYLQPYYKHDISFDLDDLPAHSIVTPVTNTWSNEEMNLLEESIWQMRSDKPANNNAYLLQQDRLIKLNGNYGQHTAGPFKKSEMTFFSPGNFDIDFTFEPGYKYDPSKQVVRLEKSVLFPKRNVKNYLPIFYNTPLQYGDTILSTPEVIYSPVQPPIYFKLKNEYEHYEYAASFQGKGALQFTKHPDTSFLYYVLEPLDTLNKRLILPSQYKSIIKNIAPGNYTLLLVTKGQYIGQVAQCMISPNGTNCINTDSIIYSKYNELLSKILTEENKPVLPVIEQRKPEPEKIYTAPDERLRTLTNAGIVKGSVIDRKGKLAIAGVTVTIKGYRLGTATDADGNFSLTNLRPGRYTLVMASVDYQLQEVDFTVSANETTKIKVQLNVSLQRLDEVVVVGYGTARKKDLTGSITIRGENMELSNSLQGKVSGLSVTNTAVTAGLNLRIRGLNSIDNDSPPLYVIDGIVYDGLPKSFTEGSVKEVAIIKDASAIALYGAKAANGVIIITTKTITTRTIFKDYALWQPNFFTDKNGHATIEVNYPDNITGWKTYVVGMDKKRRIGKASALVQAYKPLIAELSLPQFLIAGDTVAVIGKSKNYTNDAYKLTTTFTSGGNIIASGERTVLPNDAAIESVQLTNSAADTVKAGFSLQSSTGFKDGEERKIPVLKKGTTEVTGEFWILQNDTTVSFTASPGIGKLNIYAQNNTLDVMLDELEHLRKYPYYCMEQTASKLTGLAIEQKIKQQLNKPYYNQTEFDKLLQKIQKAQLFDGGWAWWENGKTNFYISNYIINALLQFRENTLVATNIRNGFLYLENQLPYLKTSGEVLSALFTLSNGKHEMDYARFINKINYDSLSQQQQWQWVSIKQQQKMNYQQDLKRLVDKKTVTMFGGVHWGYENYSWYGNDIATTIIAYKVLENEPAYTNLCNNIIQYFLEKRRSGYWANTVESATILNTILPKILSQQNNFTAPAQVSVSGDTSFAITGFPYRLQTGSNIKNIRFSKNGGGMVYLTAYQQFLIHNRNR